jgi:glycerophosphoryl diester phosphodiesterase
MTLAIAHRGEPMLLRENTLPSLQSAMANGADWVETDIKLTRDGVAVLLHDGTLDRLWNHSQSVGSLSHAELTALTGTDGWQIPTLRAAVELALRCRVPLMIDMGGIAQAQAAMAIVRELDCLDGVVFTGGATALAAVRAAAPRACIAMSWNSPVGPDAGLLRRVRPDYFNQYWRLLTAPVVEDFHQMSMKVSTWTVDDPQSMRSLAEMGVDAIISNDLRTLVRTLAPYRRPTGG